MKFNEKNIYTRIKCRDEGALKELMNEYKNGFLAWGKKQFPNLNEEDIEAAFIQALIKFYQKVISGGFELGATQKKRKKFFENKNLPKDLKKENKYIKSYLYISAKNDLLNQVEKKNIEKEHESSISLYIEQNRSNGQHTKLENEDYKSIIRNGMKHLSESHRKVLILKFYYNYDMESIARELGYDSAKVAKSTKYQAIKQLELIVKKLYNKEIIF